VSFVEEVRECAVPTRSSFLFGTAFSDVLARTESEMETVIVPDDGKPDWICSRPSEGTIMKDWLIITCGGQFHLVAERVPRNLGPIWVQ